MTYVLDTHALIWYLGGDSRLGLAARNVLVSPEAKQVIPTIVLAEINFLYQRGRISISSKTVVDHIVAAPSSRICPLDEAVVQRLPGSLNIHDGIIVATALFLQDTLGEEVLLVTKDQEISKSGLVPILW